MTRVRIGFLLPHYPRHSQSYMPHVVQLLRDGGAAVDIVHPVHSAIDIASVCVEHDLYVLRRTGTLALTLAGALHARGAEIVNPFPVSALLRDKIATARHLRSSGVPIPDTYVSPK